MEYQQGLAISDWLTIISIVVGFAATILVQSIAFFKWQSAQFEARDIAIETERESRIKSFELATERIVANREMFKSELYRVDRDLSATRHELSISIAALPTRDAIEAMLVSKVTPLESDLRALVIELARNGMHPPKSGNRYDD